MADAEGDLLVFLLDLALLRPDNPAMAAMGAAPADILAQLLSFTNAYTMLNSHNRLAIFAGRHDMCRMVHLGLGEDANDNTASVFPAGCLHARLLDLVARCNDGAGEPADPNCGRRRPPVRAWVLSFQHPQPWNGNGGSQGTVPSVDGGAGGGLAPISFALSGGLSRALCLIHRLQHQRSGRPRGRPRVLCMLGSPDASMQYIPVMNAIFSAQRAEVVIDAVVLAAEDSSFLQQAAHLTGGLYFKPAGAAALLGVLLNYFVCDTATRKQLDVTQELGVDFRASCFCHKYVIETGYVCSVCLSIFCQPSRACSTCGTAFTAAGPGAGAGAASGAAAVAAARGGG